MPVSVRMPVAVLKLPEMPFWSAKSSRSSAGLKFSVRLTDAPFRFPEPVTVRFGSMTTAGPPARAVSGVFEPVRVGAGGGSVMVRVLTVVVPRVALVGVPRERVRVLSGPVIGGEGAR